jgi:threonine/homoserine/homoserine lactone efflux protein
MTIELWLAYVLTVAVLLVIPGPTILTVIGYSLAHGRRANVALVAGVALGDSTALALSLLGLGALLAASAWWFTAVKTVGGLYLVWLGWRMLRAGVGPAEVALPAAPDSLWRLFANTWLVTALNPKGIVFFVAFLPQFITPGAAVAPQMWIFADHLRGDGDHQCRAVCALCGGGASLPGLGAGAPRLQHRRRGAAGRGGGLGFAGAAAGVV